MGDDALSVGVDGIRKQIWFDREPRPWSCEWVVGDVIGLAANVETGEMAVSRNDSWDCDGCGVVMKVDAMRKGVYPAFTASGATLRCRLADFKYGPPRMWRRGAGCGCIVA